MRTFTCILLLCLLAACGGPDGGETPEEATEKFIRALRSGSPDRVYAAVVRTEAENFRKIDERLSYNRWKGCNIDDFEILGKELDGNRYRVTVLVTREIDGKDQQSEETVVCVEEHKRWKVTMSSSSSSFIPDGKGNK